MSGFGIRVAEQSSREGPSHGPWTDLEIRVFLQEWEVVEQEVGHPGGKIHKKTRLICQRLGQRGLKKSGKSCLDLLLTMQNLHKTLCNERPGIEPLFSPYAEALYRILGPRDPRSQMPDPPYDGAGNPQLPTYPQPPTELPSSVCQPCGYSIPVPSGEFQGKATPTVSTEDSLVPRWEPWSPSYPLMVPPLLPASVPEDTSPQHSWSSSDANPGPS
ncbi:putative uncharacterized protein MSANTD5 [Acomys russatus]|uniref:putative uncharacterized protein MSANTD5 n=1 Tax=Acomys russatus TaxID=60746 RepID=UPI0021E22BBB|nr:putative uncharacterized protein MSANTD5 [Acomys russatus]